LALTQIFLPYLEQYDSAKLLNLDLVLWTLHGHRRGSFPHLITFCYWVETSPEDTAYLFSVYWEIKVQDQEKGVDLVP
jgi:hypothetical protein